MSLRAVHICFILLSIALALGFGFWAASRPDYFSLGVLSYVLGVGLVVYLFYFIAKTKRIHPSL